MPKPFSLGQKPYGSVATGLAGIAFLTVMLLGIVFMLDSVPAADILALVALLFGIIELPLTLVALLGSAYLWLGTDASALHYTIFSVLIIIDSLTNNMLIPLVLGRGAGSPMPILLLGALGGILGMFIGAVFLEDGYKVFMERVEEGKKSEHEDTEPLSTS